MIEFIRKMWELLSKPEVIAIIIAVPITLRAVGELLKKIGEAIPGEDWAESASSKISNIVKYIGVVLTWLGIGNPKK